MNNETPINVDGSPGLMSKAGQLLHAMRERAGKAVCLLDARMRTLTVEPEEGAATAEYAVVLVAATGFAAVLVRGGAPLCGGGGDFGVVLGACVRGVYELPGCGGGRCQGFRG